MANYTKNDEPLTASMLQTLLAAQTSAIEKKIDLSERNVINHLECQIQNVKTDVDKLKEEIKLKDLKILALEKDFDSFKRKNNLIFYKIKENETTELNLKNKIIEIFRKYVSTTFDENDINDIYRIGKMQLNKCRPILVSFVHYSKLKMVQNKKQEFLKNDIGMSLDYCKIVAEERKRLQPLVTEINRSGKKCFLRQDEVFVEGRKLSKEEVDLELKKLESQKRGRSPQDEEEQISKHRLPRSSLNVESEIASTSSPSTPYTTPNKIFPIFQSQSKLPTNSIQAPIPTCSKNNE